MLLTYLQVFNKTTYSNATAESMHLFQSQPKGTLLADAVRSGPLFTIPAEREPSCHCAAPPLPLPPHLVASMAGFFVSGTPLPLEQEREVPESFVDVAALGLYRQRPSSASGAALSVDAIAVTPHQILFRCEVCSTQDEAFYHVVHSGAQLPHTDGAVFRLPTALHACLHQQVSKKLLLRRMHKSRAEKNKIRAAIETCLHRFADYSAFALRLTPSTTRINTLLSEDSIQAFLRSPAVPPLIVA